MYKVWVKTVGDEKLYTNAMEYDTAEKADDAARDLMSRWYAVEKWEIHEKGIDPNSKKPDTE